jgi:uncharacterized protein (TIGR00296 family)
MISDTEGEQLVRIAREAVDVYLGEAIVLSTDDRFASSDRMGVFVTLNYLNRMGEEKLRGCIGIPLPEKQLFQSVVEAAIAAATSDPRFPPLSKTELPTIIFELSFLTTPQLIQVKNPMEYYDHIKVGRDGLILEWERGSGILLPQVARELNWDIDEYLSNICHKAGTKPDSWTRPGTKLYKFQAHVYREAEPGGNVIKLQ